MEKEFIFLLECKGIEYSSLITTESAVQKDNSTKKITSGIEQLVSVTCQLKNGVFDQLLGNVRNKLIISAVVTYKHLYFANNNWYWKDILGKSLKDEIRKEQDYLFEIKPQILSIDELEHLLIYSKQTEKNYLEIFTEKEAKHQGFGGDWINYLTLNEDEKGAFFLKEAYQNYFDANLERVQNTK